MKIQILYFAVFREKLKLDHESIELSSASTVGQLVEILAEKHAAIAALRGIFRVAVNQEMVGDDTPLNDGDEVALIPPVAGGNDNSTEPGPRYAVVLETPLSLDRVASAVRSPRFGGMTLFVGMVRNHNQGKTVVQLEYEAYNDMVERVFDRLCTEIEQEHPETRLAIEHRVGRLSIGDYAVVIAAAAAHRAEAFVAARTLIERLKEEAPIWKKETDPSGTEWIGIGP